RGRRRSPGSYRGTLSAPPETRRIRRGNRPCSATKPPALDRGLRLSSYSGGDLLSRGVTPQVPSALAVLTSVFGMGTGVSPPLWPPEIPLISGSTSPLGEAHL